MTSKQMLKLAEQIERLAAKADDAELVLPNGAIVGSLLSGIATDIAAASEKRGKQ